MCTSGVPASSSHGVSRSGSSYALCALAVGLIALGIVMIVWSMVPGDATQTTKTPGNSSITVPADHGEDGDGEEDKEAAKTLSIAYVLVGAGVAMLLLSICLGVRNKRRKHQRRQETQAVGVRFVDHVAGEAGENLDEPVPVYNVPSYEEAVTSGQFPIRQSNSQLPSYEDLICAVENEGEGPSAAPVKETHPSSPTPEPQPAAAANPNSSSRASRILRPNRVRRIKSEKLHLKDFRFNIRNPTDAKVTIEPITPPPQYDGKIPEF